MIHYEANIDGEDYTHGGVTYSGKDALGRLCRKLETGTLLVYRDGKLSMTVDISGRAKQSMTDNDLTLGLKPYQPFPDSLKGEQE